MHALLLAATAPNPFPFFALVGMVAMWLGIFVGGRHWRKSAQIEALLRNEIQLVREEIDGLNKAMTRADDDYAILSEVSADLRNQLAATRAKN